MYIATHFRFLLHGMRSCISCEVNVKLYMMIRSSLGRCPSTLLGDGVLPNRHRSQTRTGPLATRSPESVLESPRDTLEVPHTTRPGRLSALGLYSPFVRTQFGRRIPTLRASCMCLRRGVVD